MNRIDQKRSSIVVLNLFLIHQKILCNKSEDTQLKSGNKFSFKTRFCLFHPRFKRVINNVEQVANKP